MKTNSKPGRNSVFLSLCLLTSVSLISTSLTSSSALAADTPPAVQADPSLSGGTTTVHARHAGAYSLNSANMTSRRKGDFLIGNDFFEDPWVIAPATTDLRDGLGPLFNVSACQSCHFNDGRGHAPAGFQPGSAADTTDSLLIRLSRPADTASEQQLLANPQLANLGEPVYGGQLQDRGIPGVPAEAAIRVRYTDKTMSFADGHTLTLRQPVWELTDWAYGEPETDTTFSFRVAPPVIGMGLLQAIPEASILALADPEDSNQDGISGRANRVWDVRNHRTTLGRFGWKAGQPTVTQQTAGAFNGDMGLTTTLFRLDGCTDSQAACQQAANGNDENGIEVRDDILAFVSFYVRNLAVPARRDLDDPRVQAGAKLFAEAGCQSCHAGPYRTAKLEDEWREQSDQVIYPYTDLLLHDMGEALADIKRDNRPAADGEQVEFEATAREWRTPPLWGIGLAQVVNGQASFLHDGRARTLMEAVLWHDGEARNARDRVLQFNAEEREALTAFLSSL